MAGSNVFSALLSSLVVLTCIAIGQFFKTPLAQSRQGNLVAGVLGAFVFSFSLTALSNLKMASAGSSAKSGLLECIIALIVGVIASASIHRIAITLCLLFSAVMLFFLTGVSHKRYGSVGGGGVQSAGIEKRKK